MLRRTVARDEFLFNVIVFGINRDRMMGIIKGISMELHFVKK